MLGLGVELAEEVVKSAVLAPIEHTAAAVVNQGIHWVEHEAKKLVRTFTPKRPLSSFIEGDSKKRGAGDFIVPGSKRRRTSYEGSRFITSYFPPIAEARGVPQIIDGTAFFHRTREFYRRFGDVSRKFRTRKRRKRRKYVKKKRNKKKGRKGH